MSIAKTDNSLATKIVAGVVGLAAAVFMLGLFSVPAASAQEKSNAELRAQIQSLLDTISNLQARLDGESSGSSADPYMNCDPAIYQGSDLSQGDRGQAVKSLQQFLNMSADTRVAASGPGSPGNETTSYGPLTSQAVTKFQEKYAASVLQPLGLSSGTGYWGSSSKDKARQLCTQNDTGDDQQDDQKEDEDKDDQQDDQQKDEDEDEKEDEKELSGGETSLEDFDISTGKNTDVNEGSTAEVAEIEFDVEDADARVNRLDLTMGLEAKSTSAADSEPWENFEKITIKTKDGKELASVDASQEENWLDDDPISDGAHSLDSSVDYYQLRFSELNHIVRQGETANLRVVATAASGADGVDSGTVSWETAVLSEGIRARDSGGVDVFTGKDSDSTSFSIEEEGESEELTFSEAQDNPDESIVSVEENDTSDQFGVFVFTVESDEGKIQVEDLPLTFRTWASSTSGTAPTYNDVVNDVTLEVDGKKFDDFNVTSKGTGSKDGFNYASSSLDFEFDNDEFTVSEDGKTKATLFVEFNQKDGNYSEGTGVQALMLASDVANINAEGADTLDPSQDINGSPDGEVHELRTEGVFIEPNDTSTRESSNDQGQTTKATFEVKYDLTAFEEDFYVPRGAAMVNSMNEATSTEVGATYVIEDDNGDPVSATSGTTSASLQSTADQDTNRWEISEGETETFTLQVVLKDNSWTGFHNLQLSEAWWNGVEADASNGNTDEDSVDADPEEDFQTDQVDIN